MIIAVDFDGTLVEHEYPKIGADVPGAFEALRFLSVIDGVRLILWTMRSGQQLAEAVEHCRDREIEFWGVNENPEQLSWTGSPKAYAQVYVDDAAFGCPLIHPVGVRRPYVDWRGVGTDLLDLATRYAAVGA